MKTIIHVNQHILRANLKQGTQEPILTVRTWKGSRRAHEVAILGPSRIVYSPHKPLSCGARVWLETTAKVVCDP